MAELVANCPRCGSKKTTFDLLADARRRGVENGWKFTFETFSVCRHCDKSTVFVLTHSYDDVGFFRTSSPSALKGSAAEHVFIQGHISMKDDAGTEPPEHLPEKISAIFAEAARCAAVQSPNAAGTMFRLCVDLATQPLLPVGDVPGLNAKIRRDLGLRLPWLFDNHKLPIALKELSTCIKEDGNDGAHKGTLTMNDVEDLMDFTYQLLDRMFTEPKRLELARVRRDERRTPKQGPENKSGS